MRAITFSKSKEHSAPLMKSCNMLNIFDINKYMVSTFVYKCVSSIQETGYQHIFPHFSSLSLHFPNSCHKLHCSKEKVRLPQDTFDGHFNFEPETISFRKFEQGSTSKYFPKAAVTSKYFPKSVFTKKVRKKNNPVLDYHHEIAN